MTTTTPRMTHAREAEIEQRMKARLKALAYDDRPGSPDSNESFALVSERRLRDLLAELCREQDRCGIIAGHRDDIHKRARQERERLAFLLGETVDTEQYDEAVDALDERRTAATPAPGAGGHDG